MRPVAAEVLCTAFQPYLVFGCLYIWLPGFFSKKRERGFRENKLTNKQKVAVESKL